MQRGSGIEVLIVTGGTLMCGVRKIRNAGFFRVLITCAVAAIFLACGVAALRADGPNLAGTWKLNKKKSDDVRAKMEAARANQNQNRSEGPDASGSAGPPPEGGGPGGMRGPGGRGGRIGGAMEEWSQLTIEQTATTAKVSGASGRVMAVLSQEGAAPSGTPDNSSAAPANAPSGDENSDSDHGGLRRRSPPPPAAAHWNGSQLVSETQGPRGGKMTRTYELSPDGGELFVSTKMENPNLSQPVQYRMVYDRAKSN